jgi:hypothetical protein
MKIFGFDKALKKDEAVIWVFDGNNMRPYTTYKVTRLSPLAAFSNHFVRGFNKMRLNGNLCSVLHRLIAFSIRFVKGFSEIRVNRNLCSVLHYFK